MAPDEPSAFWRVNFSTFFFSQLFSNCGSRNWPPVLRPDLSEGQILSISNCFFNKGTIGTFLDARSGLQNGGQFWSQIRFFFGFLGAQVGVSWQWYNALLRRADVAWKQLLNVNMDEIYVPFFDGMASGHHAVTNKSIPAGAIPLAQDCSHPHLRTGLTHVALLCNEPAMHRLPQQVLILPPR